MLTIIRIMHIAIVAHILQPLRNKEDEVVS